MGVDKINYSILEHSIDHYKFYGYKETSVPWCVSALAHSFTKPKEATDFKIGNDYLVASAEQSFIQMLINKDIIEPQMLQAITPCFRDDQLDDLHRRYFMKNELFVGPIDDGTHMLNIVIKHAMKFFGQYLNCEIIETDIGFDIMDCKHKIELGSYGIRTIEIEGTSVSYIYGTGVAEPRLSYVLSLE